MTSTDQQPTGAQAAPNAGPAKPGDAPATGEPSARRARLHALRLPKPDAATWKSNAESLTTWLARQFGHPRVRLCVIGIALLLLAALGVIGSMWTLPLIIAGAAMIVVAWIGARLNGRFAIEWGQSGTQLEFRARIDAPSAIPPALPVPEAAAASQTSPAPAIWIPPHADTEESDVIEGEAHTVEIDVAELKALIAAAEASQVEPAATQPASAPDPNLRQRPAA